MGEVEKDNFNALLGKREPQWANTPKTMCPNLERIVRSFGIMLQRAHDELVDILLIGWW